MPHLMSPNTVPVSEHSRIVFLAGSIEMGRAKPWQQSISDIIVAQDPDIIVANPLRSTWDPQVQQSIDNAVFREQVEWELRHLDRAAFVVFYFQPDTLSPITLLEFGRHMARADAPHTTMVCCPPGFWRRGNLEVVMSVAGAGPIIDSVEELQASVEAKHWKALSA